MQGHNRIPAAYVGYDKALPIPHFSSLMAVSVSNNVALRVQALVPFLHIVSGNWRAELAERAFPMILGAKSGGRQH